jgi:hypothetical protein
MKAESPAETDLAIHAGTARRVRQQPTLRRLFPSNRLFRATRYPKRAMR